MEREGPKLLEGRVARLILLVVVSVCVVFCVLGFLQNNPVFSSVTISHILKNENYEPYFLAGFFVNQITTGKNYDRKKRLARGLYLIFLVVIFSDCNLNPLKNIAGQTTVRFFSGHFFPAKSYFYIITT